MKAITVRPGVVDSLRLSELPEPAKVEGDVLVETIAVGVCGTDEEIIRGEYGQAPEGEDLLILGHESLGRVIEAPMDSQLRESDLVVGIVRWPDPVPCECCALGEWDMCKNGGYTEHGITGRAGFARERFRLPQERLVKVNPSLGLLGALLEPATIVAKAWEEIDLFLTRVRSRPEHVLVLGAGTIGLLSALFARQRAYRVTVLDRVDTGPKPILARDIGAAYTSSLLSELDFEPDIVLECTGSVELIMDVANILASNGIICLLGVSAPGTPIPFDLGALNRQMVLQNQILFGSVNANRRHYEAGAEAIARAEHSWLSAVLNRRVPLDSYANAYARSDADIKVCLTFAV